MGSARSLPKGEYTLTTTVGNVCATLVTLSLTLQLPGEMYFISGGKLMTGVYVGKLKTKANEQIN